MLIAATSFGSIRDGEYFILRDGQDRLRSAATTALANGGLRRDEAMAHLRRLSGHNGDAAGE